MKILHLITTLERGGAENQLVIMARNQIKLGHEVNVIGLKGKSEITDALRDFGVVVTDSFLNHNPIAQIALLYRFLKSEKFDILHFHLPRAELIGALAALKLKVPSVLTRHNTESFFPTSNSFISRYISRLISKKSSAVIAISKSVRDFLIEHKEISKNTPIYINYYGFDELYSQYDVPRNLELTGALVNFVTLSRLNPQKDLYTLINAFSNYHLKFGSGKLNIYGEGPQRLELESFVRKLDMQEHIIFHGKTNDSISVLKKNQVFVLSSKYEGFGLVLLEAMQVGLPIICANNSAITEVMGKNYEGFFKTSDVSDLLDRLIESRNPIFYRRLSKYGLDRLKFFNPVKSAQNLNKIYQNALDNQMKIH